MARFRSTYHSKVYRDFKSLERRAHHALIRYFEANESDILSLEPAERFDIWYDYANALHCTGAWRKHLLVVDPIIEYCILQDSTSDILPRLYAEALFQKGVSLYHIRQYEQSEHVLRELMKIQPENPKVARELRNCRFKQHPPYVNQSRAISVLLFMAFALVLTLEFLWVRNFRPGWENFIEQLRNLLLLAGLVIGATGTIAHRIESRYRVGKLRKEMLQRKQAKRFNHSRE